MPTLAVGVENPARPRTMGSLVSTLVDLPGNGGHNNVTDELGAVTGIALTHTDATSGAWWYLLSGGSWTQVGTVLDTQALLLPDTARLYFQPNANFNGTVANAISFRAWDQTDGIAGNKVDASINGGTTAYSTATETSDFTVTGVNDAPVANNDLLNGSAAGTPPAGWSEYNGHYYKYFGPVLVVRRWIMSAAAQGPAPTWRR